MNEKTIRWYETSYRRNLVDMHIDDWNEEFFSRFDPQAYFECLKMARIQSPMIYLHSHVGLCNWPSKSGRMHAGFKGVNQIGHLIDLCHSSGMDVVGYYSLIYNCWAYDAHPEWRMVDREGHNSRMTTFNGRKSGSRYGLVCPNNMEYRAFLFTQFDEFMEIYDVEGMFLDMTFWPAVCYCDACRNRFRTETGHDLPTVMDWNAPIWQSFQRKREEWLTEFAFACSNELKRLRPDIPVEHNQALFTSHWVYGNNGGVSEASDYCGGDLYGGPYEEAFICKLYYELTENQPFEYMTSRCDPNLTDHTSTKPIDVLRIHAFLALAHHGATMFIDAIDPDGTIHPETYAAIGKVFGESMQYERFLKGGMVSDVAIYFNTESKMDIRANGALFDTTNPEMDAVLGAAKTLIDERYLLTIIPSNKQRKIFGKKVVIVSEAAFLSDEEIDLFAAYVERGGCLYMSGSTSPKLSQRLLGLEFQGYTKETITYMAPTDAGQMIYGEMFSKTIPVAFKGVQMIVTNPLAQKVLATITLPYTDPADRSVFASIHSNPPGIRTEMPAVVEGVFGKGRVIWSSASFERNPQPSHKAVFSRLVASLYDSESPLCSTAPHFVQFTLFDDPQKKCLLLHVINVQEQVPLVPVQAFHVALLTNHPVVSMICLPNEDLVAFTYEAGKLHFDVSGIDIFRMYQIEYH